MGMVGVERPGGTWGILPPLQTGKDTSTLHLPSSSACPLLPKVKRSGCKAGKKVTPSRTAPIFPAKPFSEISGLGLTCCCRSAAERPRRCATLHPAMRRGAGRKPQAANRLRTGGGERARAPRVGSSCARATLASNSLSRDSCATSSAACPELARRKASPTPHLTGAVQGAKFWPWPIQVAGSTVRIRAQRGGGRRDPEMGN